MRFRSRFDRERAEWNGGTLHISHYERAHETLRIVVSKPEVADIWVLALKGVTRLEFNGPLAWDHCHLDIDEREWSLTLYDAAVGFSVDAESVLFNVTKKAPRP